MRNTYIDNWSYVNRTAMITEAGKIYIKKKTWNITKWGNI